MTTLDNSQQTDWLQTELESMSLREDSPARTLALQDSKQGLTVSEVDCGVKSPVLLASYNPDTQSWKTSQTSLVATGDDGLDEYLETWPRSGMTRNGIAYQLPPLVPNTTEIGSLPFPTPASRDYKGAVRPETMEAKGRNPDTNSLPDAIEYRGETGRLNPTWVEWLMGYPLGHTALED